MERERETHTQHDLWWYVYRMTSQYTKYALFLQYFIFTFPHSVISTLSWIVCSRVWPILFHFLVLSLLFVLLKRLDYWLFTFQSKHFGICNLSFNDAHHLSTEKRRAKTENEKIGKNRTIFVILRFKQATPKSLDIYLSRSFDVLAPYSTSWWSSYDNDSNNNNNGIMQITIHKFNSILIMAAQSSFKFIL